MTIEVRPATPSTPGGPTTSCHGCWPMGRSPYVAGYRSPRMVSTHAELTALLLAPWCHLWCHLCRQDHTPT